MRDVEYLLSRDWTAVRRHMAPRMVTMMEHGFQCINLRFMQRAQG